MIKKITLLSTLLLTFFLSKAQVDLYQYFDGADTLPYNALIIQMDPDSQNIWQIGRPQKIIFDSAATTPNVIVTDTVSLYPPANQSVFTTVLDPGFLTFGILAVQWKQKLDMKLDSVGGMIDFSLDNGLTWQSVFNNPYVYNFYGFDSSNVDTLVTGQYAFSGTDSAWKDIWLCYDLSFVGVSDSLRIRFTFWSDSLYTDSLTSTGEGWMIDNMMTHLTIIHTAKDPEQSDYLSVYPTETNGIVHISAKKIDDYHVIEEMELIGMDGRVVRKWGRAPTKFWIDISDVADGSYYLRVRTNLRTETRPVILKK